MLQNEEGQQVPAVTSRTRKDNEWKNVTFSTIRAVSGRGTAPQVFIGGRHIGGAEDLAAYFATQHKLAA